MKKSFEITVTIELETVGEGGLAEHEGGKTREPSKDDAIAFVGRAVEYYAGRGIEDDQNAPARLNDVLARDWKTR
jgi:hypothetical protein